MKERKEYKRKQVPFTPDDAKEMELYRWLKKLDHGVFAQETKAYWKKKMEEECK